MPLLTRFAPSPTGYLHLGHVANAVYVWGIAGARGGRVVLRVEDHDRIRSRPEYERAILEDLQWLGFAAAELNAIGAGGSEDFGYYRQSDREAIYEEALTALRRSHHVYACDCSRKEIGGERYPGRCRNRRLPEGSGRGLRVQIDPGVEPFADGLLGTQEQDPSAQCGDLLLRDRDGHWTYQFAVAVDDFRQGITDVIRGADLLSSTGRQIRLARMLGRPEPPAFHHHPLIVNACGEKLSKSHGDTGVRELRASGMSADEVIGQAAHAVGLIRTMRPISADAVATLF